MAVFITEFPLKDGSTLLDLYKVCRMWLAGSPHYKWGSDMAPIVPVLGEVSERKCKNARLEMAEVREANGEDGDFRTIGGIRHTTEDEAAQWVTEVVGVQEGRKLDVGIRITCELRGRGPAPMPPKKPYLIKALFDRIGGGSDAGLFVRDEPLTLREDRGIALASSIIRGQAGTVLPVIYVSSAATNHPFVDVDTLARLVGGLAHVVFEEDRFFSTKLSRHVDSLNPFNGAVGIYWPEQTATHVRLLPRSFASSSDMLNEIEARVTNGWLFAGRKPRCTWFRLRDAITGHLRKDRETLEKLLGDVLTKATERETKVTAAQKKDADARVKGVFDEFATQFDSDLRKLEQERDELRRQNEGLRVNLNYAQEQLNKRQGSLLVAPSGLTEWFEGEFEEVVYRALDQALRSAVAPESRREQVVRKLLEANEGSPQLDAFEGSIRDAFDGKKNIGSAEEAALRGLGFDLKRDGNHLVFGYRGFTLTFSKTSSDHRALKNFASQLLQKLT